MGTTLFEINVQKQVNIQKSVALTIDKTVISQVDLSGSIAAAEASADATIAGPPPELISFRIEGSLGEGESVFSGGSFSGIFTASFVEPGEGSIIRSEVKIADESGDLETQFPCLPFPTPGIPSLPGCGIFLCPFPTFPIPLPPPLEPFLCDIVIGLPFPDGVPGSQGQLSLTFSSLGDEDTFVFEEGRLAAPGSEEEISIISATLEQIAPSTVASLAETDTFAQVSGIGAFAFSESLAALSVPEADVLLFI